MCNAEFMIVSRVMQKTLEESAKSAARKSARASAFLGLSAEAFRRTIENEKLLEWLDTETRKVNAQLGTTKVVAAGAGVEIEALTEQWAQAHVDIAGTASATRRRQAAAGDYREAEIHNVKRQRLQQAEGASGMEWLLDLGTAFAQGVALEQKVTGQKWDGFLFGQDVGGFFGLGETAKDTDFTPSSPVNTYRGLPEEALGGTLPQQLNEDLWLRLESNYPRRSTQTLTGGQFNPFL